MDGQINIDELEQVVERLGVFCRSVRINKLPPPSRSTLTAFAALKAIMRLRRLRDQLINPDFFSDPAWDILLDLAVSRIERRKVSISSLCIAAAVPATTALRWISLMTDRGLLVRTNDPADGRRIFISLSDQTVAAMDAFAAEAAALMG